MLAPRAITGVLFAALLAAACAPGAQAASHALAPTGVSEPIATPAGWSSASASDPTITDCPGTPGTDYEACGCPGEAEEVDCESSTAGCTDGRVLKCHKCPDGARKSQDGSGVIKCYTCPNEDPEFDEDERRCYKEGTMRWSNMKCDNGGALTDATATGDAPTKSDWILSECADSGSVNFCTQSRADMETACGCASVQGTSSGIDLFDATGKMGVSIDTDSTTGSCQYRVRESGEVTSTVPDGYDWKCWKCPDGMELERVPGGTLPRCVGCPPGVYQSMHGCVRAWSVCVTWGVPQICVAV